MNNDIYREAFLNNKRTTRSFMLTIHDLLFLNNDSIDKVRRKKTKIKTLNNGIN